MLLSYVLAPIEGSFIFLSRPEYKHDLVNSLIRPSRALKGPQGPYKALKGLTRPFRALQGPYGYYKALKGVIRL